MATPTAEQFAQQLDQKYPGERINKSNLPGNTMGQQWLNFYNTYSKQAKYKNVSLGQWEAAFDVIIGTADLASGLQAATGEAVNTVTQTQNAVDKTNFNPYQSAILGFLNGIFNREMVVRVVKVVGGLVLVMAGLNMLAKDETNIDLAGSVKSAAKIGAVV